MTEGTFVGNEISAPPAGSGIPVPTLSPVADTGAGGPPEFIEDAIDGRGGVPGRMASLGTLSDRDTNHGLRMGMLDVLDLVRSSLGVEDPTYCAIRDTVLIRLGALKTP